MMILIHSPLSTVVHLLAHHNGWHHLHRLLIEGQEMLGSIMIRQILSDVQYTRGYLRGTEGLIEIVIIATDPDYVKRVFRLSTMLKSRSQVELNLLTRTRYGHCTGGRVSLHKIIIAGRSSVRIVIQIDHTVSLYPNRTIGESTLIVRRNQWPRMIGQSIDNACVCIRVPEADQGVEQELSDAN